MCILKVPKSMPILLAKTIRKKETVLKFVQPQQDFPLPFQQTFQFSSFYQTYCQKIRASNDIFLQFHKCSGVHPYLLLLYPIATILKLFGLRTLLPSQKLLRILCPTRKSETIQQLKQGKFSVNLVNCLLGKL